MQKVNQKLTKYGTFRIILPENLQNIPEDVAQTKTRDWIVPGEQTIVFIEVKNCLNSPDSFSFYCNTVKEKDQVHEETENSVQQTNLIQNYNFPTPKITKSKDGAIYFPTRLTVPIEFPKTMTIGVYSFGTSGEPLAQLICFTLMPFSVSRFIDLTPQSMIISFMINVNFPEEWREKVTILSASLKFEEKLVSEKELSQNIAIISTNDLHTEVYDGDVINSAFALKPLNDDGGSGMSHLPLVFHILWKAIDNEYTSVFSLTAGSGDNDLVIIAPSAKVELLKTARMPITLTNMGGKVPRKVTLHFPAGNIQPMTKSSTVEFNDDDEKVKVIDFRFIPLVSGQHLIDITAETEYKILKPLFPIYVDVYKQKSDENDL